MKRKTLFLDKKTIIIFMFSGILFLPTFSQLNNIGVKEKLEQKKDEIPELNKIIDITVTDVDIQEFIMAIAKLSSLNINIDPSIKFNISNNFSNVIVADILIYLCRTYDLDLNFIGNIITIKSIEKEEVKKDEETNVVYNENNNTVSLNYSDKKLLFVVREISQKTGYNLILSPGLETINISGYVNNLPFETAIEKFFYSNKLLVTKDTDNEKVFIISKKDEEEKSITDKKDRKIKTTGGTDFILDEEDIINILNKDSLEIHVIKSNRQQIISYIANQLNKDVIFISSIEGEVSISSKQIHFEDLLNLILKNTPYSFKRSDNIYIFGESKNTDLRKVESIKFQNRTIDNIVDFIPGELKKDVEIIEYPELNSLLIEGTEKQVIRLENFLHNIDKSIPVIMIELIIVDINRKYKLTTGVDMGLGEGSSQTTGRIFPGVDVNLSTESINDLINRFNNTGVVNLGHISPNFYMSIQALEDQGILNIRSTPRLSTLNGHEASLSIGNTEYYLEERSDIYGTQNPQLTTVKTYKSVNAELSLILRPIVSGDDYITLDLEVKQSDFTERISEFAPPGSVDRNFKSIVRVKNQETILLGGLEEKRINTSASGVPFLSRIPVLKWFFSSRAEEDSKSRLSVFIKPIIIN